LTRQTDPIVWPGRPYPLGATWDGEGVNFALFSESAEKVELCLFDQFGRREIHRILLREQTDQVWHCYLPEARPGVLYGYRVHGPYEPTKGYRFNRNKLLLDPYAKQIQNGRRIPPGIAPSFTNCTSKVLRFYILRSRLDCAGPTLRWRPRR